MCEAWTNPDGWELRLTTDGQGVPIATIVRSADEMRALDRDMANRVAGDGLELARLFHERAEALGHARRILGVASLAIFQPELPSTSGSRARGYFRNG